MWSYVSSYFNSTKTDSLDSISEELKDVLMKIPITLDICNNNDYSESNKSKDSGYTLYDLIRVVKKCDKYEDCYEFEFNGKIYTDFDIRYYNHGYFNYTYRLMKLRPDDYFEIMKRIKAINWHIITLSKEASEEIIRKNIDLNNRECKNRNKFWDVHNILENSNLSWKFFKDDFDFNGKNFKSDWEKEFKFYFHNFIDDDINNDYEDIIEFMSFYYSLNPSKINMTLEEFKWGNHFLEDLNVLDDMNWRGYKGSFPFTLELIENWIPLSKNPIVTDEILNNHPYLPWIPPFLKKNPSISEEAYQRYMNRRKFLKVSDFFTKDMWRTVEDELLELEKSDTKE